MAEISVPSVDFNVELIQGSIKGALKEAGASGIGDLIWVPIENIKIVSGLNIRIHDADYDAHIETLTKSIIENGFYKHMPLSGFAGKEGDLNFIYCTGGFSRLAAAKRAKERNAPIEKLPVVLQPSGTNMADITSRLDTDNVNRPLKPWERATVFKRLLNFGWTEEQIATKHGVSDHYVKELMYMMGLPQALRGLIVSGKVSGLDAVRLARKLGPAEALKAYESDPKIGKATSSDADDPLSISQATSAPSSTLAQARSRGVTIPKKTLFRAIDYTLQLPVGEALKWLKRWRDAEAEAVAELEAYKPPRKTRAVKTAKPKAKTAKGKGKAKGKTSQPKTNGAAPPPAGDDPFDISGENGDNSAEDVL